MDDVGIQKWYSTSEGVFASSSLAEFISEEKALSVPLTNFKGISFELKFKYSLLCFCRKSIWPLTILLTF